MLIQPFVENSIEHAFKGIDYKGVINIKLQLQKKWITLEIEDNGVGLKKVSSSAKNSISTQLISKFIHKTTKHKVSILDKKNQNKAKTGVIVKFLIPYKLSQND
jgi:sensor histidine kinase YesM